MGSLAYNSRQTAAGVVDFLKYGKHATNISACVLIALAALVPLDAIAGR